MATGTRTTGRDVPDLEAAKQLPIMEVAHRLGLDIDSNMIRCWRPQAHQHGDRTRSVGHNRKSNRVRCFVCDARQLSTIDLVMSVRGVEICQAFQWLDLEFGLPRLPKGRHIVDKTIRPYRVGLTGNRLEPLVLCGLLRDLPSSALRLLLVIDTFTNRDAGYTEMSYRALARYSGVAKDSTIAAGLRDLVAMGAIEVERGHAGDGLAKVNRYRLTLDSTTMATHMRECSFATRAEVAAQRRLRAERRAARAGKLIAKLPRPILGSGNSRGTP